jgi:hypothetical protein
MSGQTQADIAISLTHKDLRKFNPRMTGQKGRILRHFCPLQPRESIST